MRTTNIFVFVLVLGVALSVMAQDEELYFRSDILVLSISDSANRKVEFFADSMEMSPAHEGSNQSTIAAQGVPRLKIGEVVLDLETGEPPKWNGDPTLPPESGIEILTQPRVTAADGQKAVVRSGSIVQYFEKLPDGNYGLRSVSPEVRVEITCTMYGEERDEVLVSLKTYLSAVTGREMIPEVVLDVGKPNLIQSSHECQLLVEPEGWILASGFELGGPLDEKKDRVVVLIQVTPFEK